MKLVIVGNGAMAKVMASYVKLTHELVGFTIENACIAAEQTHLEGLPLVPLSQLTQHFPPDRHQLLIAVGFREMNVLRERLHQVCTQQGYSFATFMHPSWVALEGVDIAENTVILDYVSIHPGTQIGHSTFISSNCNLGHDCRIEALNWINAGVSLAGGVTLGKGCFLGVNASVGEGVTLGPHTFVGANTFIAKDTPADSVYLSESGQPFRLNSQAFLNFAGLQ